MAKRVEYVHKIYVYIPGLVGIFRKCESCKYVRPIADFGQAYKRPDHVCQLCYSRSNAKRERRRDRAIRVTPKGLAELNDYTDAG